MAKNPDGKTTRRKPFATRLADIDDLRKNHKPGVITETWQAGIVVRGGRRRDNPRDIHRKGEDAFQARKRAPQDAVTAEHRKQQADECEQHSTSMVVLAYESSYTMPRLIHRRAFDESRFGLPSCKTFERFLSNDPGEHFIDKMASYLGGGPGSHCVHLSRMLWKTSSSKCCWLLLALLVEVLSLLAYDIPLTFVSH